MREGYSRNEGPGRGQGRGKGGPGFRGGRQDKTFDADHEILHFLLDNGHKIRRRVKNLKDGIETLTESDDPEVTAKIQEHVAAMYDRLAENRPIHMRDPLFRELFQHADKIEMKSEETQKGIRVLETSKDPHAAKLLQEHAKVVSLFIKNGRAEAHKNHAVPVRDGRVSAAENKPFAAAACCRQEKECQGGKCEAEAAQATPAGTQCCKAGEQTGCKSGACKTQAARVKSNGTSAEKASEREPDTAGGH